MNKVIAAGLSVLSIAAVVVSCAQPAAARPFSVNNRQARQHNRISSGACTGSLTSRERTRLGAQQVSLNRREARMRASGRGLSQYERARLQHQQNALSSRIYTQKHDAQNRY